MNRYLVTVPNNSEGRTFIRILRQGLKNTPQRAILRGRGHRYGYGNFTKKNGGDNRYQSSIPLPISQKIAVYIGDRPKYRYVNVMSMERVPTKWGKRMSE